MTSILVADNNAEWLKNLSEIIEGAGYGVIPATNPKQAMAIIGRHEADIAVIDLRLVEDKDEEDLSGLHVAEDTDRMVPKIIVSGFSSITDAAESLKIDIEGFPSIVDFIEKGNVNTRLLPSIERAMKIRRTFLSVAQGKVANQLNQDYADARRDARVHYLVSLTLSVLFAVPILWGAFALHSHGSISVLFAILGVLVAEVTNYLFNRNLEFLYERVERFHAELLQTNRFERLLEASHEIKDQRAREEYKIALVKAATGVWLNCESRNVLVPQKEEAKPNTLAPRVM